MQTAVPNVKGLPHAGKILRTSTIVIMLVLALYVLAALSLPAIRQEMLLSAMENRLRAVAADGETFRLVQLTPFAWDTAYYINCEDGRDVDLDAITGVKCGEHYVAGMYTLVFIKDNRCVRIVNDDPYAGRFVFTDLPATDWWGTALRKDAQFRIYGWFYLQNGHRFPLTHVN